MWRLARKGDFLDQFGGFTLERVPEIWDLRILWKPFGTKLRIDCKKKLLYLDSSLGIILN